MTAVERLTADQAETLLPQFIDLLQDAMDDGASVGFPAADCLRGRPGLLARGHPAKSARSHASC